MWSEILLRDKYKDIIYVMVFPEEAIWVYILCHNEIHRDRVDREFWDQYLLMDSKQFPKIRLGWCMFYLVCFIGVAILVFRGVHN